jgi:lysophospholipase L1-like esterase
MHRLAVSVLVVAGALASAAPAAAERYVALGDSFASGTGTREYIDAGCQRSTHAYPSIIDRERANTELAFAACSGASTADVLNGQASSLTADTAIVTISVGGNDAGFSSVITRCALPWPATCWSEIDNAQAFIRNTLPGRLDSVYGQIRSRSPSARVAVVGYPRLFNGEECNLGARISPEEQSRLNQTADLLRDVIRGRAQAAGFSFVDAIPRFLGHAVCDDVEWINGLSNPVSESYHPNRAGHSSGFTPLVRAIIG